jgi:hypothetical protein
MSVPARLAAPPERAPLVPIRDRLIRPPDPLVDLAKATRLGRYSSAQANRLLLHSFFRDVPSCIDLTWGQNGGCWKGPPPPDLIVVTNNIDPAAPTDLHVDFTSTGLDDRCFGVALIDAPHLPYLAPTAFMAKRYGTAPTRSELTCLIEAGVREAWRISDVGIIVKLTDFPNGGAFLQLTVWAYQALGVMPCYVLHPRRRPSPRRKGEVPRLPRNDGSDWLVFRRDGPNGQYPDFIDLYARQEALRRPACRSQRCNAILPSGSGPDRRYCDRACKQAAYRERGRRAP